MAAAAFYCSAAAFLAFSWVVLAKSAVFYSSAFLTFSISSSAFFFFSRDSASSFFFSVSSFDSSFFFFFSSSSSLTFVLASLEASLVAAAA